MDLQPKAATGVYIRLELKPILHDLNEIDGSRREPTVQRFHYFVLGQPREGGRNICVAPDVLGALHESLTPAWRILE